ncbi:MAG: carboxypeptidase-like regulatory domain-containing protein [Acidobacteriota bacterium]
MALRLGVPSLLLVFAAAACASAPRPTRASIQIRANPRATLEGRVRDPEGRPVAGIAVRGIPYGKDIPWSDWAVTECDGSFRLSLFAPSTYGFQLLWNKTSVITASREDPARLNLPLAPGERRAGIALTFLGALWKPVTASAPERTPSCP